MLMGFCGYEDEEEKLPLVGNRDGMRYNLGGGEESAEILPASLTSLTTSAPTSS